MAKNLGATIASIGIGDVALRQVCMYLHMFNKFLIYICYLYFIFYLFLFLFIYAY